MSPFFFAFWVALTLLRCVETMKKPRCEATSESIFYISDNVGLSSVLFSELQIHRAALEPYKLHLLLNLSRRRHAAIKSNRTNAPAAQQMMLRIAIFDGLYFLFACECMSMLKSQAVT